MKKILITGGHVTPALAVMEVLIKRDWHPLYIGRKFALEGDSALSQEYQVITKLGIPFKNLITGRLQRRFTIWGPVSLLKIPLGFLLALFYVAQERPRVVLSFGGYMAVPIVFWAGVLQIPVVIHEQTMAVGLSNLITAIFARKICVAWRDTSYPFHSKKLVITGNPLRQEIFKAGTGFEMDLTKPLLYVTGGNLGAHTINLAIEPILEKLLLNYSVIHQCGNSRKYQDFKRLSEFKNKLPSKLAKRYLPIPYVDGEHIGWVFKNAVGIIARAGANTVTEVIILAKPALFIPLPWSGRNEQRENASYLVKQQAALMIDQNDLTAEKLLHAIEELHMKKELFQKNLRHIAEQIPQGAAEQVANVVESVA